MASDINNFTVVGRLTRDADLKYSNSGLAICELSIASNYSVKRGDQWQEEVSYFDATIFGKRAEALRQYLIKGTQVGLSGPLRQERWEQDGQKRSRIRIYPDSVQLLGSKNNNGSQSGGSAPTVQQATPSAQEFEDDIPF